MNKELFAQYADIEAQIAALEVKKDALKPQLAEEMEKVEVDKVESDFGTFYFMSRKTWTYPDVVKNVEAEIKTLKKQTEEDGTATFKESKSLAFKAAK